jgi:hypothetical protein
MEPIKRTERELVVKIKVHTNSKYDGGPSDQKIVEALIERAPIGTALVDWYPQSVTLLDAVELA